MLGASRPEPYYPRLGEAIVAVVDLVVALVVDWVTAVVESGANDVFEDHCLRYRILIHGSAWMMVLSLCACVAQHYVVVASFAVVATWMPNALS